MTLHPDIINTRKEKMQNENFQNLPIRVFDIKEILLPEFLIFDQYQHIHINKKLNQNKIQLITLNNFEFYYERHRLHQQNSITKDVDYKIQALTKSLAQNSFNLNLQMLTLNNFEFLIYSLVFLVLTLQSIYITVFKN